MIITLIAGAAFFIGVIAGVLLAFTSVNEARK
jgi:hypothetical protein